MNPQLFQMINQARQNQNNPMELFKQATANYTPQQLDGLFSRAKQMGMPDDFIEQVKQGINTK